MRSNILEIRRLIDDIFALQWCRENIVVPLGIEQNSQENSKKLTIAIGNISYLGTIGDFIKKRVADKGMECVFIEKTPEEIQRFSRRCISSEPHGSSWRPHGHRPCPLSNCGGIIFCRGTTILHKFPLWDGISSQW